MPLSKKFICVLGFFLLVGCEFGIGQQLPAQPAASPTPKHNPYVRNGSIGFKDVPPNGIRLPFQTRHISEFVGERFIFMPLRTMFQSYGYQSIDFDAEGLGHLPYQDYVGKIAKVVSVTQDKDIEGIWVVQMVIEGIDERLTAKAFTGILRNMANLQDIDDARTMYLGKTLRFVKGSGNNRSLTRFNASTDKIEYYWVPQTTLVKVIDIVASWETEAPVRFILQTPDGGEGFIDVNMSGTNISPSLRKFSQFRNTFELAP